MIPGASVLPRASLCAVAAGHMQTSWGMSGKRGRGIPAPPAAPDPCSFGGTWLQAGCPVVGAVYNSCRSHFFWKPAHAGDGTAGLTSPCRRAGKLSSLPQNLGQVVGKGRPSSVKNSGKILWFLMVLPGPTGFRSGGSSIPSPQLQITS